MRCCLVAPADRPRAQKQPKRVCVAMRRFHAIALACPRNLAAGNISGPDLMCLSWTREAIVASEGSKPPRLCCLVAFGGAHDVLRIRLQNYAGRCRLVELLMKISTYYR